MQNQKIDYDIYKPLINYKYTYSGNTTLTDNRQHVNNSKVRYQNSYGLFWNLNPVNYNGVSYTNSIVNRFYFEDSALISKDRFKRDGSYATQKLYYKINKSFLSTTSFTDDHVLYFLVGFYKRSELIYETGKNFYLESLNSSEFSSTLGNSNNYGRYGIMEVPFSEIRNSEYFEIDLKSFKFDHENDPYYYPLIKYDVDINIYELKLIYFTDASKSADAIYLQPIWNNDNLIPYLYKNLFSESSPTYSDGISLRVGSTLGSNNFYIDLYDREYSINNNTSYTIYNLSSFSETVDIYDENNVINGSTRYLKWIKDTTVNIDTGAVNYNDDNKIIPNAEAIQKDSNNNIKRIFWRFDLSKSSIDYYGKLVQAFLYFYVSSADVNNDKTYPLNYIIRASSLPDSKYQDWTSAGVDNNTLNEMYDESTVLYNNDPTFGGNADIDGSLTYGKSPHCIINSGYYVSDVCGHPTRGNYFGGGEYVELDYGRRLQGVSSLENYRYTNPNINSITFILEDLYPSYSHTYVKESVSEEIYFGVQRYSTYPIKKYISSSINSTHAYKPFLLISDVPPTMVLKDSSNVEIIENYKYSITINAGETPDDYIFSIENGGRGLLNPVITKSGDDGNIFIDSTVKIYNKNIVNNFTQLLSIDERNNTILIDVVIVNFKAVSTPGIYSGIYVVLTEENTHNEFKTRRIEFEFIVNTVNELKISTTQPDPTKIFIDPEYIPEITTTLDMEFTYGDTSTKSYDIYSWNSGAGNVKVISNKFYDTFNITHTDPYNSQYRYSPYDFDPFYFTNSQGTGRYFYVTDSAVFNYKVDVNISCFVDQSQSNILVNGDISTDNWPLKNDCSTIAGGLRSTYSYKLNSSDSYSSVTTPSFNLNANKFYRFDLYLRKAGLGFDNSKISIKLLDSSNNVLKDLTPTISMWSNSLGYSMIKFVYYSDLNYTNCKILFENTNTTSSRTLYIESACVKECKPLPPGTYTGYLEFWNYDNVNPNENKVYIKYNLTINPRTGYQESAGVLFL